jgi:hypothetical protein
MYKNVASQNLTLYVVDASTGLPKTGDAANQVWYVSIDDGTVTAIASNSGVPTEIDATNAKGLYKIALSQSETNGTKLLFSGKSSTSNIVVVPSVIYTDPANYTATSINSSGQLDIIKVNGTSQTARDLGNALPAAAAGAAGGLWILGANAAASTSLTGTAASGGTPAAPALKLIGGAASTTSGGVAGQGLYALGGAGAATTNGAASGSRSEGGGTTTVSGGRGFHLVGTGSLADLDTSTNGINSAAITGTTLTMSGAVAFQSTFAVTTSTSLGAISGSTLTLSGAVALQSTVTITGATTFTGAISGTNASNDLRINGAVPGAANGLTIAGTNAATSFASGSHFIGTVDTVTTVTNQLTAAQIATGVWQDATAGDFTTASSIGKSLYTGNHAPGAASGLALVGSSMDVSSINSVSTGSVTTINANVGTTQPTNFTGTAGSALVKSDAVDVAGSAAGTSLLTIIWDSAISGHTTSGTFGGALNSAGSAGDPWNTNLPGAYAAGTAGFIVGTNLNATITSRMATYTQPTGFLAATFPSGTITNNTTTPSWYTSPTTPPTTAQIATAIFTDLLASSDFSTVGSFGKLIKDDIDATISSRSTYAGGAVASVTGNVDGNVVGSVGSVLAGVTVTTNNDKTGYALTTAGYNDAADTVLRRHAATVEGSGVGESPSLGSLYSLIQQLQQSDTTTHTGKLTVFKADNTTELGQITITSDPTAEPTTGAHATGA